MSLSVTTDVFCDFCTQWQSGAVGIKMLADAARREVAKKGWRRIRHEGRVKDACPFCAMVLMSHEAKKGERR